MLDILYVTAGFSTTSLLPLRATSLLPLVPLLKSTVGAGVGVAMCVSKQLQ